MTWPSTTWIVLIPMPISSPAFDVVVNFDIVACWLIMVALTVVLFESLITSERVHIQSLMLWGPTACNSMLLLLSEEASRVLILPNNDISVVFLMRLTFKLQFKSMNYKNFKMLFCECLREDVVHVLLQARYIQCLAFISVFIINMFIQFTCGFHMSICECGLISTLDPMCSIKRTYIGAGQLWFNFTFEDWIIYYFHFLDFMPGALWKCWHKIHNSHVELRIIPENFIYHFLNFYCFWSKYFNTFFCPFINKVFARRTHNSPISVNDILAHSELASSIVEWFKPR